MSISSREPAPSEPIVPSVATSSVAPSPVIPRSNAPAAPLGAGSRIASDATVSGAPGLANTEQNKHLIRSSIFDHDFRALEIEYVRTLGDYIAAHGPRPVDQARLICRRLARGLMDVHAQGILLKDISPDNVFLPHGDLAQAKFVVFMVDETKPVGECHYASPEHFGETAWIDQKSNMYSLGLVIAAAAGMPMAMERGQMSGARSRLQVPDLTAVPVELHPMLVRLLAPNPAHRPTAEELVASLSESDSRPLDAGWQITTSRTREIPPTAQKRNGPHRKRYLPLAYSDSRSRCCGINCDRRISRILHAGTAHRRGSADKPHVLVAVISSHYTT